MIVVADDLGRSGGHNEAILRALEEGLVTAASAMATGEAFEEAVAAMRERGLERQIGVHLVLTEGEPLTEAVRRCRRFCGAGGRFIKWRSQSGLLRLERTEREAVAAELRAQVERARAVGLPVSHLDSHHHVHIEWPLGTVVVALAKELGVPRVRLARNCGPGIGLVNGLYKRLYNARLRRAEFAGTRYFGNPADWLHLKAGGASDAALDDFEVMTHPLLDADRRLVDEERPDTLLLDILAPLAIARSG